MTLSRLLVLLFALTLFPAAAQAEGIAATGDRSVPGQVAAPPSLAAELEAIAGRYWGGRGVALPPLAHAWVAPDASLDGASGRGEEPGSQVWLAASHLPAIRDRRRSRSSAARLTLCETYLHERGHNAGLTHEAGWIIMAETTGLGAAPRCESWAYQL